VWGLWKFDCVWIQWTSKRREIIILPGAGFCGGVEFAVEKTLAVAKSKQRGQIFLDGELVHNCDVSGRLFTQGIPLLPSESNIAKEDTIIIRAHGISPQRRLY
jgi:4-hydroxy-3-methylbut-2-enyl diphosphate reductase